MPTTTAEILRLTPFCTFLSTRWEGQVMPAYSETYTFYTQADDGVRLWVNGQLLVNDWNYHGTVESSGTITLVAGQKYDIRMEYFQGCCGAAAALLWSSPSQGKEIIPQSRLLVPAGGNYQANALNQYTKVGVRAVGYDGNFNITSYDGANFSYNAQNQLVSGTKGTNLVQFTYDGLGRCLKRTTNGASIVFAYDGWKPIAEWAEDGSYWGFRIYGSGPDEVLWHYDSRVGYMRVHSDMHGNVMALLDWSGNGVEKYGYDAFGRATVTDWSGNGRATTSAYNRFMFQGREWIAELGIYDYRHRMYQPELGRFLQTDPTGFDAGDMNLFRYCGDDPVDGSDPLGLIDRRIDREIDKKGIQASLNSLKAAKEAKDGVARSQAIQERKGKLSLGKIAKGKTEEAVIKKSVPGGFKNYHLQKEGAIVDNGSHEVGAGHVHMDETARADPNFSEADKIAARGSEGHPGMPIYKVNESNPERILRLTPQINYRDEPTIRPVSP